MLSRSVRKNSNTGIRPRCGTGPGNTGPIAVSSRLVMLVLCPEVRSNCHERVYLNALAQRSMGDIMERHRGQRRSTNVMVRFFARPATVGIGPVLNVSATGAFMESELPLRLLSVLYLEPMDPLPSDGTRRIAATVVRYGATG